jgi:Domain of unknown function (DUF4136)
MTRTRTIVLAVLSAALLTGLAGCATLRTSADYDSHVDFASYHTYAFKDVHPGRAAILDHRIKSAVAATFAAKGLREDAANPDLWVVTHARVVYEPSPVTWEIGWGWGWPWGPGIGIGRANAYVERIPVGTLIVDLVDVRAKELVWRGKASDVLDRGASPADKDAAIASAVTKMFEAFPPQVQAHGRYGSAAGRARESRG